MYNKNMKPIIDFAMNYNIKNLSTYKGYDGADLLKFTFHDNEELLVVRDFCRSKGFEAIVKLNDCPELICVFECNEEIYGLKR